MVVLAMLLHVRQRLLSLKLPRCFVLLPLLLPSLLLLLLL